MFSLNCPQLILVLLGCGLKLSDALCTTRNVTVIGLLGCGDRAVKNVEVELREHDILDPDDSLNKTVSNSSGHFTIYGEECEIGNIEPYLRIQHNCEDGALSKNCIIADDYKIPEEFVGRIYDMGIVSLNIARSNHWKKCD